MSNDFDMSAADRRTLLAWLSQLVSSLTEPLPDPDSDRLDDPTRSQEWALLEWARLRHELQQEGAVARRSFTQGQICAWIADGHTRAEAARMAGITAETLARWRRADSGFAEALRAAEQGAGTNEREHWRSKMTEGVRDALLRLLRSGATRKGAAEAVGVSRQTFYTWLNTRPDFRQAVLAAEAAAPSGQRGHPRGARSSTMPRST